MKHYIVLCISILLLSYYLLNTYNSKSDFNHAYNTAKEELLSQETAEYVPIVYNNTISNDEKSTSLQDINKINLDVDFFTQSPFWKWGVTFEETCEEASALIAINYIRGISMSKTQFRDELLKMVDWQNENLWFYKDTWVDDTGKILSEYFDFTNFAILENPTIDDIKYEISQKNIIISPFYASNLNPYYSWSGPDYHFMVITGYTPDSFIVHDVWTQRWEDYHYNQNTLYNRIHDFDSENIQNWAKRLIVLRK